MNSMLAQPPTEMPCNISIYDYYIDNFMCYSIDSAEQQIVHILNKNNKHTFVVKKDSNLIENLKFLKKIYYQDKIYIHSDLLNMSDPFVIITNEDILT